MLKKEGTHGVQDLGEDRRGCIVIEVNSPHPSILRGKTETYGTVMTSAKALRLEWAGYPRRVLPDEIE
jgi:glutathione synthase/RimK-type ligase-like ATP-grasp enzyme